MSATTHAARRIVTGGILSCLGALILSHGAAADSPRSSRFERVVDDAVYIFTGIVIAEDGGGPKLSPMVTSVPPWQRAMRARMGLEMPPAVRIDTVYIDIGPRPYIETLVPTAWWKGVAAETLTVVSRVPMGLGSEWLVFTGHRATFSEPWRYPSVWFPSGPVSRAAGCLYRLPTPEWQDPRAAHWPVDVERLMGDAQDEDLAVAMPAARQLADLCDHQDEVMPLLAGLLTRATTDSAADAVVDMLQSIPSLYVEALAPALQHPNAVVRRAAIRGIAYTVWEDLVPAVGLLSTKLVDPDPEVRSGAATVLGYLELEAAPAYSALISACADSVPKVRETSALAVGSIGPMDGRAVTTLMALLNDPSPEVRAAAARALGHLGVDNAAVRDALEVASSDQSPHVRECARRGITDLNRAWRAHHTFNEKYPRSRAPCANF
ncbi:MAG: HEAT repeat domain-containing protein [Candidatus Eisenbacteria bacterium]